VDHQTGEPQPNARVQTTRPDALSYGDSRIVELKPVGPPLAKDRQEIIRFIRGFQEARGRLPETI
jgi:hypothetical protein